MFQAALAQAEELWDAAAVAGARSRALPLFYCLSQGGRAICAAWTDGDAWEPRGHGLSGQEPPQGTTGTAFVSGYGARVDNRGHGAYGMVAAATASPVFSGTATVAQLWTSMPTFPTPRTLVEDLPRCLHVEAAYATESGQDVMASVLAPTHAVLRKPPEAVPEALGPFPTAQPFEVTGERAGLIEGAEPRAIVAFPGEKGGYRPLREIADRVPAEGDGFLGRHFALRPPVGDANETPPSQFMTLWALLLSASQLTRYYPAAWVGALDEDESEVAVTLDHGLELALALVPELLSDALSGPVGRWVEELRRQQVQPGAEGVQDPQQQEPLPPPEAGA